MLYRIMPFLFAFLSSLVTVTVEADGPAPGKSLQQEDQVSSFFMMNNLAFRLYGGNFVAESDPQFVNMRNQYTLGLGFSAGIGNRPNLALDVEYFFSNRDYDTQLPPLPFSVMSNDTSLETNALLIGGRGIYPADGLIRAYAVGGLGLFKTTIETFGSTFGLPGKMTQDDTDLNIYYGAGIELRNRKWVLSFDYRHFNLSASFSDFQVQDADIGGDILVIGLGRFF